MRILIVLMVGLLVGCTKQPVGLRGGTTPGGASGGGGDLAADGSVPMTGPLDLAGNDLQNVGNLYLNATDYWYSDGDNAIWSNN